MLSLITSLFFFVSPAFSQVSGQQQISVDTFCGMDNTDPSNTLRNCECQDCLNVEASVSGNSVRKRNGVSLNAALTVSTSAVTGNLYYVDNNGNNIVIVCQDVNCSKSVNSSAFSNFVTTATPTPRYWSLVAAQGLAYGANDKQDKIWILNNGAVTYSTTIPQGKILDFTQDRMISANTVANPNSVNYSKSGDFTAWTAGVNSVDPWSDNIGNPGQQITGLRNWNGTEYIFMDQSITACQLGDQYTTLCNLISPTIGTNDPTSIILTAEGIMFKGSDSNFWLIDANDILHILSRKVHNLLITASSGKAYSNTQTTKSDFDVGSQNPSGSWGTSISIGAIAPSTYTATEQSSSTFVNGTLVNVSTTVTNSVYITRPGDVVFTNAGGESSDNRNWAITNGDGVWTNRSNAFMASNCPSSPAASQNCKFGSRCWQDTSSPPNIPYLVPVRILDSSNNIITSTSVSINNNMNWTLFNVPLPVGYSQIKVYIADASTSQSIMISSSIVNGYNLPLWFMGCDNGVGSVFPAMDWDETISQPTSGSYTSQCYDTSYSTPTWGPFNVTISSNDASSGVTFQTRVAATCGGSFDSAVTATNGQKIASATKEAVKYIANFTLASSTNIPAGFTSASLNAATTGQFMQQCANTNGMSSSYGTLNCDTTFTGAGSVVFAATSTASCSVLPAITSGTWTSVINNSVPTISTNSATWIRYTSLLGSSTDQAQVNSCVLNWINGTLAPPVWGFYDSVNNDAYWSFSINQSTFNSRVIKYDLHLDGFYPFDYTANSMMYYNNNYYFGGSNGGYWYQWNSTNTFSDQGNAINAYYKTKDFYCVSPFQEGVWNSFSFVNKNEPSGSITNTWTLDRQRTGNYSVSVSTTSTISYVRSNYLLPDTSPATFINFNLGNNAASSPFEIVGYNVGCTPKPWRVLTP